MLRAHWAARRRDRESWRAHVRRACGRRRTRVRGRVRLEISVHRRARQDPDNAYASVKPLLDALVHVGWLEDDSAELLTLEVTEHEEPQKAAERTVVRWIPERPEARPALVLICGRGPRPVPRRSRAHLPWS
jgi:hypothetical protein